MYDRHHYYFSFGGTSFTNTEIWQTGFRAAPIEGAGLDDLLAALPTISLTDCLEDLSSVIKNQQQMLAYSATMVLRWCKLAIIKPDGKYAAAPRTAEANYAGFSSNLREAPPQLAWVATLGTGHSFGMAQSGRMYWPVPPAVAAMMDNQTGATGIGLSDLFRDLIKPALAAVEGEIDTNLAPAFIAVMSKSGGVANPNGVGTTNPVTEISVGRALDTMRSRRSNVQELYSPVPALAGTRDTLSPRGASGWRPTARPAPGSLTLAPELDDPA